ncbi:MAG: ATP-dependent helicase, partial [Bradymonadaceae bacterium]
MLEQLNPPQEKAVHHEEGPLLILAGAGSGKTRVITCRIAHLIANEGVDPEAIVAVTFTNKAAEEMRERVAQLLGRVDMAGAAGEVMISTFHSLGARLLRWHGRTLGLGWNFTILDQDDQMALVKEVAEREGHDLDHSERKELRRYIEGMKNRGRTPQGAFEQSRNAEGERDAQFYETYQETARETNVVDFGDLLLGPLELFRGAPGLADAYGDRWQYVMVDEFQDTNPAQYELLDHLTSGHRNLAVVGDDDQSIYRWRDATVDNILDFDEDFPATETVKLEQNYRSTELILGAANDLIQNNPNRKEKTLWTSEEGGAPITLCTARDDRGEAAYVADEVQTLVRDEGASWGDMAIFYRTNAQGRQFEEQFRSAGIPYRVVGGTSFYGREEIKDILSYLQLALNPEDDVSLLRIIGKPTRGVGDKTVEKLRRAAEVPGIETMFGAVRYVAGRTQRVGVGLSPVEPNPTSPAHHEALEVVDGLGGRPKGGVSDFCDLLVDLREQMVDEVELADLVEDLLDRINYFEWLEDRQPERAEDKKRNLVDEDLAAPEADRAVDGEEPVGDLVAESETGDRLRRFLERSSLVRDAGEEDEEEGVATLMTIHGAKGLEFDTVFMVGMEEGLFPNLRGNEEPEELYEERRLAYVAITRAEQKLYITNAQRRRMYGKTNRTSPSRFLLEIDDDRIEIDPKSSADEVEYASKSNFRRRRDGYTSSAARQADPP